MRPALALLLAALLGAGCRHAAPAAPPPAAATLPAPAPAARRAFVWEVTRAGMAQPLYVAGSVHARLAGPLALPPALEDAFERASTLVVEVDPGAVPAARMQALAASLGTWPPPTAGLSAHLAPETRALLPAALARAGLEPAAVEPMRPWLLSMVLVAGEAMKAGYSPDAGVDRVLLERARGRKAIVELETLEEQLHVFADLPDATQDLLLREQLEHGGDTAEQLALTTAAWERGDAAELRLLLLEKADDPAYAPVYEAIFYRRNARMADAIARLAAEPGVHLVVVGAGHLVGDRGIPAELERRGFTVRQLPAAPGQRDQPAIR